jgi:quercetin dioxygenase-like cupin family protein
MFVRRADASVEQMETGVTRQILGHDPQLMLVRVTFAAGAEGYVHHHPHRQVTYVERGTFEVRLGEETTVLHAGDCFFVSPGVPHGVKAREEGSLLDTFTPAREDFLSPPRS